MSPEGWVSDVYDPRFGNANAGAQCGAAEFDRFTSGLNEFEDLFRLREPTDEIVKSPFCEIEVDCDSHRYIWLVPNKRTLSQKEQALVGYISSSWLRLASKP